MVQPLTPSRRRILVVEDDPAIRRGLVDALGCAGYAVTECERGDRALQTALGMRPDLVLLDVVMPGLDGFEVLQGLRSVDATLPVIMVTARGAETDRVQGLQEGADDYVVKPFSARELLARVEAVLRRSAERSEPSLTLRTPGVAVHLDRGEVVHDDGRRITLSEKEGRILRYLASSTGRPVSRDELLQRVWGLDPRGVTTRAIDMHVARLREKLRSDDDAASPMIVTVRSRGYMLDESVETANP